MTNIMGNEKKLKVVLIDNNPLDRAVIDAVFNADKTTFELRYSCSLLDNKVVRAIGLNDLKIILENSDFKEYKPNIVLLDLALTSPGLDTFRDSDFTEEFWKGGLFALSSKILELKNIIEPIKIASIYFGGIINKNSSINYNNSKEIIDKYNGQNIKSANTKLDSAEIEIINKTSDFYKESLKIESEIHSLIKTSKSNTNLQNKNRELEENAKSFFREVYSDLSEITTTLTRAPELFEMFSLIALYPQICFGIISHFASIHRKEVLSMILSFRYPLSKQIKTKIFSPLICDKAHLFGLNKETYTERLKESYIDWKKYSHEKYYLAPFSNIPVVKVSNKKEFRLFEFLREIKSVFEKSDRLVIIFDETEVFINGWSKHPNYDNINDVLSTNGNDHKFAMTLNWSQPLKLKILKDKFNIKEHTKYFNSSFIIYVPSIDISVREFYADLSDLSKNIESSIEPNSTVLVIRGKEKNFKKNLIRKITSGGDKISIYEIPKYVEDGDKKLNFKLFDSIILNTLLAYDTKDKIYKVLFANDINRLQDNLRIFDFLSFEDYLHKKCDGEVYRNIIYTKEFMLFRKEIINSNYFNKLDKSPENFWQDFWKNISNILESRINKIENSSEITNRILLNILADSKVGDSPQMK
ncbi:hypothetical protein [Flavivirga rizhaonensis]|uniref:Uncharacterized protein n=1 Tax=Flavivirga rizhaonensis TaxID=2559571 RepID=A0A4S1DYS6_9FLAO|nr:hypothetical protein [Flavivirga rizhaonensis]TGV03377.1 hypothetical protein EM932_06805 [Flavivirga rizhaonensis]